MRSEPPPSWSHTTWGQIAQLAYGKALRDHTDGPVVVYGTNGPTGRTTSRLGDGPTVVIGRKGAYRGVHYAPEPFWVIDTAFFLLPTAGVDMTWAYYELLTRDINGLDSGSAIPSTRREDFYALPVKLPPLTDQRRIARVLRALDDKIHSNRRLAKVLDDAAATLFRARFIDFVGVAGLTHSEIGGIPRGWSVRRIDQLAAVNEVSLTAKCHPTRISYVDISAVGTRSINRVRELDFDAAPSRARRVVRPGDTILSTVRPERRSLAFIHDTRPNMTASTGFAVVTPTVGAPTFVYRAATSDTCIDHLVVTATGSAYPAVNPREVAAWRVAVPPDCGADFEEFSRPLEAHRYTLDRESTALSEIRDALLPRLISGQIRVPDTADPEEVLGLTSEPVAARTE